MSKEQALADAVVADMKKSMIQGVEERHAAIRAFFKSIFPGVDFDSKGALSFGYNFSAAQLCAALLVAEGAACLAVAHDKSRPNEPAMTFEKSTGVMLGALTLILSDPGPTFEANKREFMRNAFAGGNY